MIKRAYEIRVQHWVIWYLAIHFRQHCVHRTINPNRLQYLLRQCLKRKTDFKNSWPKLEYHRYQYRIQSVELWLKLTWWLYLQSIKIFFSLEVVKREVNGLVSFLTEKFCEAIHVRNIIFGGLNIKLWIIRKMRDHKLPAMEALHCPSPTSMWPK